MFNMNVIARILLVLIGILFIPVVSTAQFETDPQQELTPYLALSPDDGFPVWITDDVDDYLPLAASQTSGLDWVGTEMNDGENIDWLVAVDDNDRGTIHLITVDDSGDEVVLDLKDNDLTLPPPDISMLDVSSANGYDFEAVALHPWSESIFISQEGALDEIAIYVGKINTRAMASGAGTMETKVGETNRRPQYISSLVKINLPGWDEVFVSHFSSNLAIEGMAIYEDRLFMGLESPYSFSERLMGEKSTIIAIWKINPYDPSDMESCELLAVHDTADWSASYGYTIETICGLDALDRFHIVGVDRDFSRLFTVEFTELGEFVGGRYIYLDTPGPAVLPSDGCEPVGYQPDLVRPALESVCVVPAEDDLHYPDVRNYHIYLACDPWGPGWALVRNDWECESYERRLVSLLPALYRYTVTYEMLFP